MDRPPVILVLTMIVLTISAVVLYLIFSEEDKPQFTPSVDALETIDDAVTKASIVFKFTELIEESDRIVTEVIDEAEAREERLKVRIAELEEYVVELEGALVEATEWMESLMEVLDGR